MKRSQRPKALLFIIASAMTIGFFVFFMSAEGSAPSSSDSSPSPEITVIFDEIPPIALAPK